MERLNHGQRIVEILKQPQYKTLEVEKEVVILFAVTNKYLDDIPLEDVLRFETEFFSFMEAKHNHIFSDIKSSKQLSSENEAELRLAIESFKKEFK